MLAQLFQVISVPYRLVSMLFSECFGLQEFYGLMLEQFLQSDTLALHWSIQPGVSDGCLEMFSTRAAAQDHIEVVRRHWLGVEGPLLAMVQLQIRTDRLVGFIQRGSMAFEGGKLKIFETRVSGTELSPTPLRRPKNGVFEVQNFSKKGPPKILKTGFLLMCFARGTPSTELSSYSFVRLKHSKVVELVV